MSLSWLVSDQTSTACIAVLTINLLQQQTNDELLAVYKSLDRCQPKLFQSGLIGCEIENKIPKALAKEKLDLIL